jgi:predicted transcriptional regulator YdeE
MNTRKQPGALSVSVVTRPAQRVIGMAVRTSMRMASRDCPRLWHDDFASRMREIESSAPGESYGVSWGVEEKNGAAAAPGTDCSFDYWAALPVNDAAPVPQGMRECYLPEGRYAECQVASLAELPAAYAHVYEHWLPGQNAYAANVQGPSYELYPEDYPRTGRIILYCALRPR